MVGSGRGTVWGGGGAALIGDRTLDAFANSMTFPVATALGEVPSALKMLEGGGGGGGGGGGNHRSSLRDAGLVSVVRASWG